ncbi:MAG: hypothetical protein SFZ23_07545 [Planctomycetota bacterium]|nr:hypothetical protein [Planctomycetota bacterium]
MTKLPSDLLRRLRAWKNYNDLPDQSSETYNAFFDAVGELQAAYSETDFQKGVAKLTDAQRRAGALILLTCAIPMDGLFIGVLVNQPEVMPHAVEAARTLGLSDGLRFLDALAKATPKGLLQQKTSDARMTWAEENESPPELEELEASELAEVGAAQMQLAAMKLVVTHADEFFEA